jgi:hypothetical protein
MPYVTKAATGSGLPSPYTQPMIRPLRIEFPGAVHHVTSQRDRREPIYRDDADRALQLEVLAQAVDGRVRPDPFALCTLCSERRYGAAAATDVAMSVSE